MNCHDALLLLEFARPGATELEAADIAALETHLADCPACAAFARQERQSHDRLANAMAIAPMPSSKVTQLQNQLSRQRRRSQLRSVLIGASCFAFAWALWWAIPGPPFDPYAMLASAEGQFGNSDVAQTWLTAQNSRFQYPAQFRKNYLLAYARHDFYGVSAPVLTFVHGNSMARVAVLTPKQFRNLPEFQAGQVAENSSGRIHILRDPNWPDVVYVVEVINGSIEPFLVEEKFSAT